MLLPMLKWDQEGISVSCSVQFPPHNYTSRQCTALENVLESVKVGVWSVGGCVECRWVCGVKVGVWSVGWCVELRWVCGV